MLLKDIKLLLLKQVIYLLLFSSSLPVNKAFPSSCEQINQRPHHVTPLFFPNYYD